MAKLVRKQPQSVSELAEQCHLTLPVVSQSLRALEARGLLKVRRIRRRVEYRIPVRAEAGTLAGVITALRNALQQEAFSDDFLLKLATAFTHPSRILIVRPLASGPKSFSEIQLAVRLSAPALSRHLSKLLKREFISYDDSNGKFSLRKHREPFARALTALALN